MSEQLLSYLAGFFDGEGCIGIAKYKRNDRKTKKAYYVWRLKVTNKDYNAVKLFQDTFHCGFIAFDKRSDVYDWMVTGKKALMVTVALLPFLRIKQTQAALGGSFNSLDSILCEDMRRTLSNLKHPPKYLVLAKK